MSAWLQPLLFALSIVLGTLLYFALSSFRTDAQEAAPLEIPLREKAINAMANTPLLIYDRNQALFVAAQSYECAGFISGMKIMMEAFAAQGKAPAGISVEEYVAVAEKVQGVHIGIAQIIHLIWEVDKDEAVAVMTKHFKIAYDNIDTLTGDELDTKYGLVCKALLETYIPRAR